MERYALELAVLLGVHIVGSGTFAMFEAETAAWRKIVKWTALSILTLLAARWIGHAAVAIPIGLGFLGATFHVWWCLKNGIHPLHATPRRRYYQLRGWAFPE